jgi:hypothetical protein
MKAPSVRPVRCAIYTRVSTEHGLDQEFNSLDAQYDAASAYIKSQAHAGWTLIRDARGSRGTDTENGGLASDGIAGDTSPRTKRHQRSWKFSRQSKKIKPKATDIATNFPIWRLREQVGHSLPNTDRRRFGIPSCAFLSMTPALFAELVFEALRRSKLQHASHLTITVAPTETRL